MRKGADRVEAEYIGEPRPEGLAGKLLAPSGGVVQHFDRFLLPSIAQVEYRIGDDSHLLVTSAMTPADDWDTVVYAVVTFRMPLPHWLVKPFLTPVALHIFGQDATMLARQTETLRRFGSRDLRVHRGGCARPAHPPPAAPGRAREGARPLRHGAGDPAEDAGVNAPPAR